MSKRSTTARPGLFWRTMLGHRVGATIDRPRRVQQIARGASPILTAAQQRRAAELEQELQLARDIQQGLLLEAVPHLPGWELAAISNPARDLGGDLYDFLSLGGGVQGIMIGDVSGKGLPAALRMAVARTVFRHEARCDGPPGPTLARVNRGILSEIPQGMVTMLYLWLDPRRGLLRIANAGHIFPLLVNGRVSEIELSGLPLGVDVDSAYEEAAAELQPGDSLILYTDGVLEAENERGEIFGFERLGALVAANACLKPRAMVALLLRELRSWSVGSPSDDVTMVVLRRRLARLDAELRGIVDEVLSAEHGASFWDEAAPRGPAGVEAWLNTLPDLLRLAQARFGRGLARELNQRLRLAIEDYRQ